MSIVKFLALLVIVVINSNAAMATLSVGEAVVLEELTSKPPIIVDALWLAEKNLLVVSKQGSPPETLIYDVDFDQSRLSFVTRQRFESFAPMLIRNRNFVLAFKVLTPSKTAPELYKLDDTGRFQRYHSFAQDVKNIAATEQSNFVATIDYAASTDVPIKTPRLKLFSTGTKGDNYSFTRQGNAVGIINIKELMQKGGHPTTPSAGRVTAFAMSRMARTGEGAANRVIALAHATRTNQTLHIWYFPSIEKDFNTGRGHITMPINTAVDTIELSPNTFGLVLATSKTLGKIFVMQFDLARKTLVHTETLSVETAKKGHATHMAAGFGDGDAIIAGINESLFLFEKNKQGKYEQTDVQPADFGVDEYFSKIEIAGRRFISVGTKGAVQFGTIQTKK